MIEATLVNGRETILLNPDGIDAVVKSKHGYFDVLMRSGVIYAVAEDPTTIRERIKQHEDARLEKEAPVSKK